jgi:hypothetical protein
VSSDVGIAIAGYSSGSKGDLLPKRSSISTGMAALPEQLRREIPMNTGWPRIALDLTVAS